MSTATNTSIEIKPYSLTELSHIYGVTVRTIKKWILLHETAVGAKTGRYYTALQVKIIFEKLGVPGVVSE